MPQQQGAAARRARPRCFKVTLDREVTCPWARRSARASRSGNGFIVKGCDFGYNRSRGILIKASRGQVIGNKITHGWMAAVLVAPEYLVVRVGQFQRRGDCRERDHGCRRAAIEIIAPGGNGKPLPAGAHRNMSIVGNTIDRFGLAQYLRHLDGWPRDSRQPAHAQAAGTGSSGRPAVGIPGRRLPPRRLSLRCARGPRCSRPGRKDHLRC